MSKYTTRLYDIINIGLFTQDEVESWFTDYELSDFLTTSQILTIQKAGVWNKEKLAKKIVNHYLMQEIGSETIGLFRHRAKIKMNELMEEKLPLIYSAAIQYDPLVNVDYTETFTRNIKSDGTNSGESNSESTSNSNGITLNSNTPQGRVSKDDILSGKYVTTTSGSESEANANSNTTTSGEAQNNTDENYEKRVRGNSGVSATAQKMVEQFRENIIAIDRDIIRECSNLFMGLL
jgi:hypothetical protein